MAVTDNTGVNMASSIREKPAYFVVSLLAYFVPTCVWYAQGYASAVWRMANERGVPMVSRQTAILGLFSAFGVTVIGGYFALTSPPNPKGSPLTLWLSRILLTCVVYTLDLRVASRLATLSDQLMPELLIGIALGMVKAFLCMACTYVLVTPSRTRPAPPPEDPHVLHLEEFTLRPYTEHELDEMSGKSRGRRR